MGRGAAKKQNQQIERRRKPRGASQKKKPALKAVDNEPQKKAFVEFCKHCDRGLTKQDRALFVEEEVGRVFCSEACIADYFGSDVTRLEQEYFSHLAKNDLTAEQREKVSHFRWMTLQSPQEIWRERTLQGDYRYRLISKFEYEEIPIWSICICLFLKGEPSFLFLAFSTKNEEMMQHYQVGEEVERVEIEAARAQESKEQSLTDGLASHWTEEESMRAELNMLRRGDDIPESEYRLYESCLEQTLDAPDEVWKVTLGKNEKKIKEATEVQAENQVEPEEVQESQESQEQVEQVTLYHFIRYYDEVAPGIWYVIVARASDENEEEIELVEAFPTRDQELVDHYRRGSQEVGSSSEKNRSLSRLIH